ncbi:MAG TPA: sugar transferase [Gaiellaceae bacterium]|nr:sugar transferase [Gaiellaceae bacterium]
MVVIDQAVPAVSIDARTARLLERRRRAWTPHRRGWVMRRLLLGADVVGLSLSFLAAALLHGDRSPGDHIAAYGELALFLASLPVWILLAKLHGLYERDEERADHSTVDDIVGVLHVVTIGAWFFVIASVASGIVEPNLVKLASFWALAIGLVATARAAARAVCRRSSSYLQNTIILGAGDVGQLVARKLLKHPEYGLNLVGFVDDRPRERREDLEHLTVLGTPDRLRDLIKLLDVDRVVVAFSNDSEERMLELVRSLNDEDVQIDVVPRLFDLVGPRVGLHTVEGLPLVGLPPARLSRSSTLIKRGFDIAVASVALLLTAPLIAFIAWRVKRDSPGPVFFRQTRLGLNMREFTALKFRTMKVDTDPSAHRDYIEQSSQNGVGTNGNGLFKLDRSDAVTRCGRWLRRSSLDELPQLINVLRGEMSLVGPRPCIDYETKNFAPHHFERFLVPAGITGLWQVTARANATFAEALDMDVSYVRGWSLGLDLRLLCRTPFQLLRQRGATA